MFYKESQKDKSWKCDKVTNDFSGRTILGSCAVAYTEHNPQVCKVRLAECIRFSKWNTRTYRPGHFKYLNHLSSIYHSSWSHSLLNAWSRNNNRITRKRNSTSYSNSRQIIETKKATLFQNMLQDLATNLFLDLFRRNSPGLASPNVPFILEIAPQGKTREKKVIHKTKHIVPHPPPWFKSTCYLFLTSNTRRDIRRW